MRKRFSRYKFSVTAIVVLTLVSLVFPHNAVFADGSATGTVFRDYNANGAQDAGEPGYANITVTAYDSTGAVVGTTTSAANGSYTIAWAGTAETRVRIEFSGLPSWATQAPFAPGAGSATSVQYVDSGDTGANYALMNPADYTQSIDAVRLVTTAYEFGANSTRPAMLAFDYIAPATITGLADPVEIGSTWGLAYRRPVPTTTGVTAGVLYAAAFAKRQVEYGPGGSGAIYAVQDDGANAVSVLATIPNAGATVHDSTDYARDPNFYDVPGKQGLGGLDISDDQQTLYVMNLNDRNLYSVNIATGTPTALGVIGNPTCGSGGVYRPFAVAVHDGLVYVGGVCTSEGATLGSAAGIADLHAYVFTYNPLGGAVTQVLDFPLGFQRGCGAAAAGFTVDGAPHNCSAADQGSSAEWQPWSAIYPQPGVSVGLGGSGTGVRITPGVDNDFAYSQPVFAGITFLGDDMIVAFRDRMGDQIGHEDIGPNNTFPTLVMHVFGSGDLLRASSNGNGTWTIENNAAGATFGPSTGANNQQGPGGGEFFFGENFAATHNETVSGGIVQIIGQPDVVSTVMDPDDFYTQGIKWLSNTAGSSSRVFRLLTSDQPLLFGKSNGLGDLVPLLTSAPIEIGNYVWNDVDRDGIQDPGEPLLAGVTVELVDAGGNVIDTAVTDTEGRYIFSSDATRTAETNANYRYGIPGFAPNSTYTVRIPMAQSVLTGLSITINNASATNRDSNGVATTIGGLLYSAAPVTTGRPGQNDHTFDFGFSLIPPTATPTLTTTPNPGGTPVASAPTANPFDTVEALPSTGVAPAQPESSVPYVGVALVLISGVAGTFLLIRRWSRRQPR